MQFFLSSVDWSQSLLAFMPPPSGANGERAPFWITMVPWVLFFVILYVVLIRPQQVQARKHAELLKGLKTGDRVTTSSGLVGIVLHVKEKDKTVSIRSGDSKLEVLKSSVTDITERDAESKE